MSDAAKAVDAVIREGLAKSLKADGYSKTGRTWRRVDENCVRVVNIQASQANIGSQGEFTMNLGIHLPVVAKKLGQEWADGRLPKEYECTVRTRIGSLMPGGGDNWWVVTPQTDRNALAQEIQEAWLKYGKPWVDEPWRDLRRCQELLVRNHGYLEAIAASLLLEDPAAARDQAVQGMAWYRDNGNENASRWLLERARALGVKLEA